MFSANEPERDLDSLIMYIKICAILSVTGLTRSFFEQCGTLETSACGAVCGYATNGSKYGVCCPGLISLCYCCRFLPGISMAKCESLKYRKECSMESKDIQTTTPGPAPKRTVEGISLGLVFTTKKPAATTKTTSPEHAIF